MEEPMQPSGPRPGRAPLVAGIIVAVLVLAVAAGFLTGAFDSPPGREDRRGDAGGGVSAMPLDMKAGDSLEYSVTIGGLGKVGTMRLSFLNVTKDSYEVKMEQDVIGRSSTMTWNGTAEDILGNISEDEWGELGEPVGTEVLDTPFGPKKVLHYHVESGGEVHDHYIGEDSPILYRTVLNEGDRVVTIELVEANTEEIRSANA